MKSESHSEGEPNKEISLKQNVNVQDICRLCLSKEIVNIDIFDNNQNISLPLRIMACASLEVNSNDQLPKRICTECRYQLEKSYVFRKKCKNSDTKLRRHFRLINAGKKSDIIDMSDDEEEFADSMSFFAACKESKLQQLQKEREDREKEFQNRMQNFMESERKRFHEEESQRIIEQHQLSTQERNNKIIVKKEYNFVSLKSKQAEKNQLETTTILNIREDSKSPPTNLNQLLLEKSTELKLKPISEEQIIEDKLSGQDESLVQEMENIEEVEYIINEDIEDEETVNDTVEDEAMDDEERIDEDIEYSMDEETSYEKESINHKEPFLLNTNLKPASDTDGQVVYSLKEKQKDSYTINKGLDITPTFFHDQDVVIDDIDLQSLTNAVKSILSVQVGISVKGQVQFRLQNRKDNNAEVEITTDDGSVVVMEIELDSMLKKSGDSLKSFTCRRCPKSFSKKGELTRHMTSHVKEKGVCCVQCEKWFPSKSALERHVRIHTGEKPFKCDDCGKSFIQKEILKRHLLIHTGEKPYQCPHCEKAYTQNDMLRHHINRKHSEFPIIEIHKCPLCTKTFSYASGLSRHLVMHTGKVFTCEFCIKSFTDKSAKKRHVQSVHINPTKTKINLS